MIVGREGLTELDRIDCCNLTAQALHDQGCHRVADIAAARQTCQDLWVLSSRLQRIQLTHRQPCQRVSHSHHSHGFSISLHDWRWPVPLSLVSQHRETFLRENSRSREVGITPKFDRKMGRYYAHNGAGNFWFIINCGMTYIGSAKKCLFAAGRQMKLALKIQVILAEYFESYVLQSRIEPRQLLCCK